MCHILAVFLVLLAWPQEQKVNKHSTQKQSAQKQVQPPQVTKEFSNPSCPDAVIGTQFYTYNSNDKNWPETIKVIFDGLLVAVTVALVWVGWKQAKILRKHEEWMQKHDAKLEKLAQAASNNAKALINSERAWVTVFVEWVKGAGHLDKVRDNGIEVFVNLICSNRGHSPAWIVERIIKAEISTAFPGPDISTVHDSMIDRQWVPLAPAGVKGSRDDLSRREYAPGIIGNEFVLIYGVVRYRDVFTSTNELRETWFGFYTSEESQYDPLTRIAQPEYNRYT